MKQTIYLTFLLSFVFVAQSFADNFAGPLENDTIIQLTPDGVKVVADEYPSGADGKVFVVLGDNMYFVAQDDAHGQELWKSNGTPAGTMVIDVWPGDSSSSPNSLTVSGGKVFFSAYTSEYGRELYWTDGVTTEMVFDIYEGSGSASPQFLTDYNGKLLFAAEDALSEERKLLWITDGTEDGTLFIGDVAPQPMVDSKAKHIQVIGDKAFFAGDDGKYGTELWITKGTFESTYMILDITYAADPEGEEGATLPTWLDWFYGMSNGNLIFRAQTPAFWLGKDDVWASTHNNLWISDGTAAGTYCIKDLNPDPDPNDATSTKNSGAGTFAEYKGELFFRATDPIANNEPWITDGTADNTKVFYDLNGVKEGDGQNKPSWMEFPYVFDSLLFFSAMVQFNFEGSTDLPLVGKELWATDKDSIYLVKDIFEGTSSSSSPKYLTVSNKRLYFQANNGASNSNLELWACDPRNPGDTAFNVYMVFDEIDNGKPIQLTDLGGNLIFTTISTQKLYVYDDGEEKSVTTTDPLAFGPPATGLKNPYIERYQSEIGDTADYHPVPSSIKDLFKTSHASALNIYPNPANDMLTVNIDTEQAILRMYSITGSMVYEGLINRRSSIDISELAAGIYTITAEFDNHIQYSKLIVE